MGPGDSKSIFEAFIEYTLQAPTYHIVVEVLLVVWVVYLLFFSQQYKPKSKHDQLTKEEEDELIAEWNPEPLVPDIYPKDKEVDVAPVTTGVAGPHITVNGKELLNFATYNFLGLLDNPSVKDAAANSIKKYGVGSCGPRGFYGTVDAHLKLEEKIAKFMGCEESILYSYGFATISSVIPAYSKRRDIIFCDEGVCFPIQRGLIASRSKLKFFKHNDMHDLERLLIEQKKLDEKNPAKAKVTRKFLIAEALYMNYGDLCPLPKLVEFRKQYNIPIILEESLSFGVLGRTGRGATEHFGISPEEVDLISASVDMSLASVGGFCAGKTYVVDHQRLSGLGYCFSASVPPMMAVGAMEALDIMEQSPEMFSRLRENAKFFRKELSGIKGLKESRSEPVCPVINLCPSSPSESRQDDMNRLEAVVAECRASGVAIVTAKYLEKEELFLPPPGIRLTVCSEHTQEEISKAAQVIKDAAVKFFT